MKKVFLRYGIKGAIAELVFFVLTWLVIYITNMGHEAQGYIGYVDIICPLLFVYFGVRYYRDHIKDGRITFMQALKVGLLIVILPTLSFAIIETTYTLYIDPKFYDTIFEYDMAQYSKTHTAAQIAVRLKGMNAELAIDKNPLYNFIIMVVTIGLSGTIIAVISSLLLMRKVAKS